MEMKFEDINVSSDIVRALNDIGLVNPTLIQEKAIPLIQEGKDLVGISKTGSGKTAAFGVPLLEKMEKGKGIQGLIIVPTRELAVQISKELVKFGKYSNCFITTVFGGVALDPQIQNMRRAEIVVGTPGRLLDHLERGNLDLSHTKCVVLDEADKMVEMGFIEDIDRILSQARKEQMLLFGATISDEINYLKKRYMTDPATAEAEKQVKGDFLAQYYYDVQINEKFSLLVHLLKKEQPERAIIFCSARATVDIVAKNLRDQGIKAEMIHGKLTQNKRLRAIENFHKGKPNILVASSVAARGLDIKDVTHVFNYDLSQDPQEYVHRIGRTARAGETGKAITLLSHKDYDTFSMVLERHEMKIEKCEKEDFPKLRFNAYMQSRGTRNFAGRRGGFGRNRHRFH
ncbi:DEAD/DEAH box helicase [Candidatus Woesearchaeota archaeon]|nr:DEAD/DEAH box helicase [Candidatus Woesearchaeota archaeon]